MKFSPEPATDVDSLLEHLDAAGMQYVDVQGREAGRVALAQWPLLARLRACGLQQQRPESSTAPRPNPIA